jgi:hypothetical protein
LLALLAAHVSPGLLFSKWHTFPLSLLNGLNCFLNFKTFTATNQRNSVNPIEGIDLEFQLL